MKYKKVTILSLVMVVILSLLTVFIFAILKPLNSKIKNEKSIQEVVKLVFTCPNEELIQLYSDLNKELAAYSFKEQNNPDSNNSSVSLPDENEFNGYTKIDNKIKEMYARYFTVKGYESLYRKMIFNNYVLYSTVPGYNADVIKIEITQSDRISSNYSFKVFLRYGPTDGDKKDIEIDGSAQITEEVGKLSYIQFFDRDLYMELWDKR